MRDLDMRDVIRNNQGNIFKESYILQSNDSHFMEIYLITNINNIWFHRYRESDKLYEQRLLALSYLKKMVYT